MPAKAFDLFAACRQPEETEQEPRQEESEDKKLSHADDARSRTKLKCADMEANASAGKFFAAGFGIGLCGFVVAKAAGH